MKTLITISHNNSILKIVTEFLRLKIKTLKKL